MQVSAVGPLRLLPVLIPSYPPPPLFPPSLNGLNPLKLPQKLPAVQHFDPPG